MAHFITQSLYEMTVFSILFSLTILLRQFSLPIVLPTTHVKLVMFAMLRLDS